MSWAVYLKVASLGMPEWLSRSSARLLVLAQVVISELWDEPHIGLCTQHGLCLRFFPLPLPFTLLLPQLEGERMHALSQINK